MKLDAGGSEKLKIYFHGLKKTSRLCAVKCCSYVNGLDMAWGIHINAITRWHKM